MKLLIFPLLFSAINIFCPTLHAQSLHLDVEGDAKIRGKIDINHAEDTTTVLIGRNAGINVDSIFGSGLNTFVGTNAGRSNTTGKENSFFGFSAGKVNTEGRSNSYFGRGAGDSNTMGSSNSFFGYDAGQGNRTGHGNSFFGYESGWYNGTGHFNSFFGYQAGTNNINGTRNTMLGYDAEPTTLGDSLDRAIAIGYQARVDCHRCAVIGGTGADAVNVGINTDTPTERLDVHGNAAFRSVGTSLFKFPLSIDNDGVLTTDASDRRLKENITDIDQSLEKVLTLRGITYNWKTDETKEQRIGLIAQEVEEVLPEVVFTNEVDGFKGVRYQEIVALLIEAIKEQQTAFNRLNQENVELRKRLDRIEGQLVNIDQVQTRE